MHASEYKKTLFSKGRSLSTLSLLSCHFTSCISHKEASQAQSNHSRKTRVPASMAACRGTAGSWSQLPSGNGSYQNCQPRWALTEGLQSMPRRGLFCKATTTSKCFFSHTVLERSKGVKLQVHMLFSYTLLSKQS